MKSKLTIKTGGSTVKLFPHLTDTRFLRPAKITAIFFFVLLLKGSAQTVITLGAGQTIQAAYSNTIPATISGAYLIELSAAYTPASESYPVVLGAKSGASLSNTITIRPATGAGSLTITSINTTSTFDLNGSNYIIIDGREGKEQETKGTNSM